MRPRSAVGLTMAVPSKLAKTSPAVELPKLYKLLARELEADELSVEPALRAAHAGDKWFASHEPDVVALPKNTASVSRILAFASKHQIPVTPRGAGYG